MECPKCNKTYDEDYKFCPYCGEEKPELKFCPKCELEPNSEFKFCPECDTELVKKTEYLRLLTEKASEYKYEYSKSNALNDEYKLEKALEYYSKAIELEPNKESLWSKKADCLNL